MPFIVGVQPTHRSYIRLITLLLNKYYVADKQQTHTPHWAIETCANVCMYVGMYT